MGSLGVLKANKIDFSLHFFHGQRQALQLMLNKLKTTNDICLKEFTDALLRPRNSFNFHFTKKLVLFLQTSYQYFLRKGVLWLKA